MTHYRTAANASFRPLDSDVTHGGQSRDRQVELQACDGCGNRFRPKRSWQKQCSPRCRQRVYIKRQPISTPPYYGA